MPIRSSSVGQHVDGVHVLVAHLAPRSTAMPAGQCTMQRVGDAALVGLALPAPERRVARHGPAPRVVVVDARAADLVDALVGLLDGARQRVPDPGVVERTVRAALGRRAVVGQHHDDRVVELAERLEPVDQPTELVVGVGEEPGEALHVARVRPAARRRTSSSHAGTQSGRGDSSVCAGQQPLGLLAGQRVARATRPSPGRSGRGSARSTSGGAWCGEWHAPVAR